MFHKKLKLISVSIYLGSAFPYSIGRVYVFLHWISFMYSVQTLFFTPFFFLFVTRFCFIYFYSNSIQRWYFYMAWNIVINLRSTSWIRHFFIFQTTQKWYFKFKTNGKIGEEGRGHHKTLSLISIEEKFKMIMRGALP